MAKKKIKKNFKLVVMDDGQDFEDKINELTALGWKLQGNMFVDDNYFHQAMVLPEPEMEKIITGFTILSNKDIGLINSEARRLINLGWEPMGTARFEAGTIGLTMIKKQYAKK